MICKYVTSTTKSTWNGSTQVTGLVGIDENSVEFNISIDRASKEIRTGRARYFLWDGHEKTIELMSVANYVEAIEQDDTLNLMGL